MTDKEIVEGLLGRDDGITRQFFFVNCRPLFRSVSSFVFSYEVDYDEFVNELYQYLMEDDGLKLRQFQYRSSIYQWLKVLALRYFIQKRDGMIEDVSKSALYKESNELATDASESQITSRIDLERLFGMMENKRYVYIIRKLVLDEVQPELLAKAMGVTTANLYNIKKRAMAALTRVALKDIKGYGKKR